jgi:hypothetical protein
MEQSSAAVDAKPAAGAAAGFAFAACHAHRTDADHLYANHTPIAAGKKVAAKPATGSNTKRKSAPASEPELEDDKENGGKKPKKHAVDDAEVKPERQDGRAFRSGTQNVSYKDTSGRIKAESYEVVTEATCETEAEALSATGGADGQQIRRYAWQPCSSSEGCAPGCAAFCK